MKTLLSTLAFTFVFLGQPAGASESSVACEQKPQLMTSLNADDPTAVIQKCMMECQKQTGGSQDQLTKCLMECISKQRR